MKPWLAFTAGGLAMAVLAVIAYETVLSKDQPDVVASGTPSSAEAVPAASAPAPVAETTPSDAPSPLGTPAPPPSRAPRSKPAERATTPAATPEPQPEPVPAPVTPVEQPKATTPATPAPGPTAEPASPPPPPRVARSVTIPEGTLIGVRLNEPLSSAVNKPGDTFTATLDQPLVVDGFVIAERGARVQGEVANVVDAGRVKGLAQLEVVLTHFNTSDGQRIRIGTASFAKEGPKETARDAAKVGIGAGIGAAIGAIVGGGKNAAIGGAAGAGAGTGAVLATKGKPAELPSETKLTFRLAEPVKITEKMK